MVAEVIRNPPVDRDVIIVEQESDGDSSIADGEDTVGSAKGTYNKVMPSALEKSRKTVAIKVNIEVMEVPH